MHAPAPNGARPLRTGLSAASSTSVGQHAYGQPLRISAARGLEGWTDVPSWEHVVQGACPPDRQPRDNADRVEPQARTTAPTRAWPLRVRPGTWVWPPADTFGDLACPGQASWPGGPSWLSGDATLVSPLTRDDEPHPGPAAQDELCCTPPSGASRTPTPSSQQGARKASACSAAKWVGGGTQMQCRWSGALSPSARTDLRQHCEPLRKRRGPPLVERALCGRPARCWPHGAGERPSHAGTGTC